MTGTEELIAACATLTPPQLETMHRFLACLDAESFRAAIEFGQRFDLDDYLAGLRTENDRP
ncbi:hypothetical protein FNU77_24270 [Prescottella equi]|uniref:hypothetical protein n=1 Tax=Rhodococcus hoagii TaxID=43767 RepID=UPI00116278A0|nr:hypothetical protein [Prescottella equi]QDP08296.1 hypothetical protein FNU77_00435 [Prescottella equi]QDP12600.1 hypothetical protein FNU77_24270 [Prescottella equi]